MATDQPEPHTQTQTQTLAAGELVWAKTKGRHHWWPARLHSPSLSPVVSSLGAEYSDDHRPAAAVKPFLAAPDAHALARANTGLAFLAALAHARATAVAILCDALTCPCARHPDHPPPPNHSANKVVITAAADLLDPRDFLAALASAALDPSTVGLLDHARLVSWARALAQGWGPDGPGRYQRRTQAELADKIDLDMLAEDGAADDEEQDKKPHKTTPKQRMRRPKPPPKQQQQQELKAVAHKTPKQRQRRRRAKASLMDSEEEENLSAGEEEEDNGNASSQKKDESGTALSGRRERKKSKYLSPPYTNISVFALEDKSPDSPKKSPPRSASKKDESRKKKQGSPDEKQQQHKNKAVPLLDNVDAQEVLLLVRCFGEDVSHKRNFPKAAEDLLGLLRSSVFAEGADHDSYKEHDCPAAKNAAEKAAPIAGLVPDSAAAPKQGKGKRGRKKKDEDASGDYSVKKKMEKSSHTATALDCPAENASEKKEGLSLLKRGRKKKEQDATQGGSVIKKKKKTVDKTPSPKANPGPGLVITPAIPIRQVSAEDIMGQVKPGGMGVVGVPDPKMKNNLLVSKSHISAIMLSKSEEVTVEATKPDTDMNVDALDVDVPVGRGAQTEVTMPMNVDMNVDTLSGDLPARSVAQAEAGMDVDTLNGDGSAQVEVTMPETGGIQVDMNVECVVDVPVTAFQMEAMELGANIPVVDINEQVAAVEDVPAAPLIHGDVVSQPADGNQGNASAVQGSYTSLIQAMVPEMYKKVEAAGTGVVTAPQGEGQKFEQETSQKKAVAANHSCPAKGTSATTNGASCPDAPNSAHKRRSKKPAAYFANPAELRVKFLDGTMVPTKEELLSEFRRFGVLVESECDISEDRRDARVVFGKSTEAEAAYTKAEFPGIFGQFGPPWATLGLNYLEAITVAPARPAKPPLDRADMRKNVENMISSLKNGRSVPLNVGAAFPAARGGGGAVPVSESLLAEMQRLLSKLDKTQPTPGPSGSSAPPSS